MTTSERIRDLQSLLDRIKVQVESNRQQCARTNKLLKDSLELAKRTQQDVTEMSAICERVVKVGMELMLLQIQTKLELDQVQSENAQQS